MQHSTASKVSQVLRRKELARVSYVGEEEDLTRWAISERTPVWLSIECCSGGCLPHVVEGCKQDDVRRSAGKSGLDRAEGSGLVGNTWDGEAVGASSVWPSGLGDDNLLAGVGDGGLEERDLLRDKSTCTRSGDARIEERMAVGCAVVRASAKSWVCKHGSHGIDGNDGSSVTGGLQEGSNGAHGCNDCGWRSGTVVDGLITNADSINIVPISINCTDDECDL